MSLHYNSDSINLIDQQTKPITVSEFNQLIANAKKDNYDPNDPYITIMDPIIGALLIDGLITILYSGNPIMPVIGATIGYTCKQEINKFLKNYNLPNFIQSLLIGVFAGIPKYLTSNYHDIKKSLHEGKYGEILITALAGFYSNFMYSFYGKEIESYEKNAKDYQQEYERHKKEAEVFALQEDSEKAVIERLKSEKPINIMLNEKLKAILLIIGIEAGEGFLKSLITTHDNDIHFNIPESSTSLIPIFNSAKVGLLAGIIVEFLLPVASEPMKNALISISPNAIAHKIALLSTEYKPAEKAKINNTTQTENIDERVFIQTATNLAYSPISNDAKIFLDQQDEESYCSINGTLLDSQSVQLYLKTFDTI